ncbi:MAG: RluA family pseudouridine synthase [Spirochaetes bacterium]|nr:RluA family pseudouridine synthase [Spirochaetota bacterium]
MKYEITTVTVPEDCDSVRLDRFLTDNIPSDLSRSYIAKIIGMGCVSLDGEVLKQNFRVKADQVLKVAIPEPEKLDLTPQNIPLEIIYDDSDVAVINKPAGLIVHPGAGALSDTLVNALLFHLKDLSGIGGVERPGIVHRLDRDTAGLMVIAKNDAAHSSLASQFENRTVDKVYAALTMGKPTASHFFIEHSIARHPRYRQKMTVNENGRSAKSEITVRKTWNTTEGTFSLLKVKIYTGRTHQIRVHLSSEGLPIVGDPVYSKSFQKFKLPYLLLSSVSLGFTHPSSGERMEFSSPLPEHFLKFIDKLDRSGNGS